MRCCISKKKSAVYRVKYNLLLRYFLSSDPLNYTTNQNTGYVILQLFVIFLPPFSKPVPRRRKQPLNSIRRPM